MEREIDNVLNSVIGEINEQRLVNLAQAIALICANDKELEARLAEKLYGTPKQTLERAAEDQRRRASIGALALDIEDLIGEMLHENYRYGQIKTKVVCGDKNARILRNTGEFDSCLEFTVTLKLDLESPDESPSTIEELARRMNLDPQAFEYL